MKDVLRKVQPQSFLDIAALNALYRPGPMQFIDDYADRKHGRKTITYIFPELEEILGETYGIIVYQEQVMRIAVEIAGFSLAKADTLRKAMGKKKQEIIDREGENFISGAVAKGHPKDKARQLWNQIVPFAKYGFNKSHSVAYAHVAYITAYLKAHYPAHFMAAMLTSEVSNTDKLSQYLVRSRQMGIEILPPDINASMPYFTVEEGGIRFGLAAIKGVGLAAVEPLLVVREQVGEFSSLSSCLRSLPARSLNQKALECLAKAGCFDTFGLPRKGILDNLEQLLEMTGREREQSELGQGFLFDDMPSESLEEELRNSDRAEQADRLSWEREVLGFYLTGHPLHSYREQLERYADSTVAELAERFADRDRARHRRWAGERPQGDVDQEGGPQPRAPSGGLPARRGGWRGAGGRVSRRLRGPRTVAGGRRGDHGGCQPQGRGRPRRVDGRRDRRPRRHRLAAGRRPAGGARSRPDGRRTPRCDSRVPSRAPGRHAGPVRAAASGALSRSSGAAACAHGGARHRRPGGPQEAARFRLV